MLHNRITNKPKKRCWETEASIAKSPEKLWQILQDAQKSLPENVPSKCAQSVPECVFKDKAFSHQIWTFTCLVSTALKSKFFFIIIIKKTSPHLRCLTSPRLEIDSHLHPVFGVYMFSLFFRSFLWLLQFPSPVQRHVVAWIDCGVWMCV